MWSYEIGLKLNVKKHVQKKNFYKNTKEETQKTLKNWTYDG